MPKPLLWTLRGKMLDPLFLQQRTRANGGLLPPKLPVNAPWNTAGHPLSVDQRTIQPTVIHQLLPYPPTYFRITGTTRDANGAALGNCTVDWFNTADDVKLGTTTSDSSGAFEFRGAGQPPNAYYLVAYLAGSRTWPAPR
jgi:hypothetical protein